MRQSVAAHQHAHVVDAHLLHQVQFLGQTLPVATLSLAGQNGTVPEVGPDVAVLVFSDVEAAVAHGHEVVLLARLLRLGAAAQQRHEREQPACVFSLGKH